MSLIWLYISLSAFLPETRIFLISTLDLEPWYLWYRPHILFCMYGILIHSSLPSTSFNGAFFRQPSKWDFHRRVFSCFTQLCQFLSSVQFRSLNDFTTEDIEKMKNVSFSDPEYTNKVRPSRSSQVCFRHSRQLPGAACGQPRLFLRLHPAVLRSECTYWAGKVSPWISTK